MIIMEIFSAICVMVAIVYCIVEFYHLPTKLDSLCKELHESTEKYLNWFKGTCQEDCKVLLDKIIVIHSKISVSKCKLDRLNYNLYESLSKYFQWFEGESEKDASDLLNDVINASREISLDKRKYEIYGVNLNGVGMAPEGHPHHDPRITMNTTHQDVIKMNEPVKKKRKGKAS